jgi:transposase
MSPEERQTLEVQARRYTLPYRDVIRAKIVLLAAQGIDNDEIALRLDTRREIVSKWLKRFFEGRLAGLEVRPRLGRPGALPPAVVIEVKAIACELPGHLGLPLSRLHVPDIRQEVLRRGLVAEISGTMIWRWLSEDAEFGESDHPVRLNPTRRIG